MLWSRDLAECCVEVKKLRRNGAGGRDTGLLATLADSCSVQRRAIRVFMVPFAGDWARKLLLTCSKSNGYQQCMNLAGKANMAGVTTVLPANSGQGPARGGTKLRVIHPRSFVQCYPRLDAHLFLLSCQNLVALRPKHEETVVCGYRYTCGRPRRPNTPSRSTLILGPSCLFLEDRLY